ncbi:MAG TPA: Imm26 family immunity protein [Candidatus Baltobacteraceae bacterium]|nr:Imm26 family immunity protein [Candidatus Baltobacteraceae bacterium]
MKRRYKAGDWLRIPLGGEHDALAILARACRSRLFGYFFAVPAGRTPTHDELRALSPKDALAAMLFGGGGIEHGRWQIIATSLAFDEQAWPFPPFASRGAFARTWTQVRYDPQTLQILERTPLTAAQAQSLPDARFADARDVETVLRRMLAGETAPRAQSVCQLRSPIDPSRLRTLEHGGTLQFSTPLSAADLEQLRVFIEAHPHVQVRVHGFRHGFDALALAPLDALRDLTLEVHHLKHPQALAQLRALRTLRIGAAQIDLAFIDALPALRTLELRGTRASLAPVERCAELRSLLLENTPPPDFPSFAGAPVLEQLTLAHGEYDLDAMTALRNVSTLKLRALDVPQLPPLHRLERLERLELCDLGAVSDLRPLASAPSLRELRIEGMPQLNVADFEALQACAALRSLEVEIGSRRKTREIYRLMKVGNT